MSPKETSLLKNVELMETSMAGSGNERSQSHYLGKFAFQFVDRVESPSQKIALTPTKKVVKETPTKKRTQPPTSVEGVDWVVLNPKASLIKTLFKQKSPSKLNVGEASIGIQSVVYVS
jgi:hypothetical protein